VVSPVYTVGYGALGSLRLSNSSTTSYTPATADVTPSFYLGIAPGSTSVLHRVSTYMYNVFVSDLQMDLLETPYVSVCVFTYVNIYKHMYKSITYTKTRLYVASDTYINE
jgi:hypothetical protein